MDIPVSRRCNLRCQYCLTGRGEGSNGALTEPGAAALEERVRRAVESGVSAFRLTGGEPLLREDIVELVSTLARIPGVEELHLTTNGVLLGQYAWELKKAGLTGLSVHVDTLDRETYAGLTGGGDLDMVADGLAAAETAGFGPLRLSVALTEGLNEEDLLTFVQLTLNEEIEICLSEELLSCGEKEKGWPFLSSEEIRSRLPGAAEEGPGADDGPVCLRYPGAPGRIRLAGRRGCGEEKEEKGGDVL
ncbi:MAG: radical SAM protein [Bacillota bacterium]|nr:radical SAM protein [Bacillota bacterium]